MSLDRLTDAVRVGGQTKQLTKDEGAIMLLCEILEELRTMNRYLREIVGEDLSED